jgi:hypothetical protein
MNKIIYDVKIESHKERVEVLEWDLELEINFPDKPDKPGELKLPDMKGKRVFLEIICKRVDPAIFDPYEYLAVLSRNGAVAGSRLIVSVEPTLREQLYATIASAGMKIISDDLCCRILAYVYTYGGGNEMLVFNDTICSAVFLFLAFWADWRIGLAFIARDISCVFADLYNEGKQ